MLVVTTENVAGYRVRAVKGQELAFIASLLRGHALADALVSCANAEQAIMLAARAAAI